MPDETIPMYLSEFSRFSANCYLIRAGFDCFLIDTGPAKNRADDWAQANASVERLRGLEVRTVYPGHGRPFSLEAVKQG